MSKMICNICGSDRIVEDGYYGGTTFAECEICNANGDIDFIAHYETIFDRITASEEVLAEKFVIKQRNSFGGSSYKAILLVDENGNYRDFYSRKKAIAATVARLNEVAKCESI
jgi:hypothetical protein